MLDALIMDHASTATTLTEQNSLLHQRNGILAVTEINSLLTEIYQCL
jgi:hypothetical protein